ncbi:uncharacterized HTH La-type RNA-binding protein C1527.03-like isoform X1 [Zingiber officinale]|uniref:uncharacterized HTH La-type RNA-binding protein C1527.03-like isoform X1 n=1 Tax=Zingiber officinale TaxID=94328 RepID=UPI001C4BFD79|nr:uncharacterized HTH La-type RNA-binding protein C1527.03-like isoform X1 [Zingiber officinale]XP_042469961.1 uncharacterized HTH La-type RNA-binding protein C1527.03-like isoform X1 [Zingiber officinale]XP_042469962.1 uncharacterized HTH La-type RNA-binding protein C1527.03-like isoform X1 [Zingiber officinale]XP_042469963.1 uncharacterized HTH La-type RNA-binding protein C1527.03-like isoform X1 [Zingiber officinale]XP_042469964.1 uncharacterized HTH La-type RNA-binding protein C1527.03-lik
MQRSLLANAIRKKQFYKEKSHTVQSQWIIFYSHASIQVTHLTTNTFCMMYLFSVDNLCKDIFLRGKMDDQGWAPVSLIATFNMVKRVTTSTAVILNALRDLIELEIQQRKLEDKRIGLDSYCPRWKIQMVMVPRLT